MEPVNADRTEKEWTKVEKARGRKSGQHIYEKKKNSPKPYKKTPTFPENPRRKDMKRSDAHTGISGSSPADLVDNNSVHEPPTGMTERLLSSETGLDILLKHSTSTPPTTAQMTRKESRKSANDKGPRPTDDTKR